MDASVAMNWLIRERGEGTALALLNLYGAQEAQLIAPRQIMDEVASALAKLHRRKVISFLDAHVAFQLFTKRRPDLWEGTKLTSKAFDLSLEHQVSFWDSLYLALAIDQRADLVTADQRFYRSVSRHYPFVKLLG